MITSDEQLRAIIPNLQRTAASEPTWFERIRPFIDNARQYIRRCIIDPDNPDPDDNIGAEQLTAHIDTLTAWRAWADAIPMLDLVATPNGFGVVSNQNIAPASRDRVTASLKAAVARADAEAITLVRILLGNPYWLSSPQGQKFWTLYPSPEALATDLRADGLPFGTYLANSRPLIHAERTLAQNILSDDALEFLRNLANYEITDPDNYEGHADQDYQILHAARHAVILRIQGDDRFRHACRHLQRLLDTATGSATADIWRQSQQYKAYKTPPFQNEKESSGFFF